MNLGRAIRICRAQKGYTLKELSSKTGLSASYLSHLERNQRDPSLSTVQALAESFEIPLAVLVFLAADEENETMQNSLKETLSEAVLKLMRND